MRQFIMGLVLDTRYVFESRFVIFFYFCRQLLNARMQEDIPELNFYSQLTVNARYHLYRFERVTTGFKKVLPKAYARAIQYFLPDTNQLLLYHCQLLIFWFSLHYLIFALHQF